MYPHLKGAWIIWICMMHSAVMGMAVHRRGIIRLVPEKETR